MSIRVIFECSGCDAKAEGTDCLRREFISFSGRSHGFGQRHWVNTPDDIAPEGWVASDPYTECTYCPACWAGIMNHSETTTEATS